MLLLYFPDPVEDVAPTVGFAPEGLEYRGCEITIYDLGGGSKIRPVWKKYFSEVSWLMFCLIIRTIILKYVLHVQYLSAIVYMIQSQSYILKVSEWQICEGISCHLAMALLVFLYCFVVYNIYS